MKPDDALAYNHLASAYFLCKDYPKALETYKMGLKVDPNHPFLHFNLAELYKEEKLYKEAINSYQTAIKTKPNWDEALTAIADCYVEIGEFEKAIETCKMLIDSNGKSEGNFTKLAKLYEAANDDKNAEAFYKKAIALNENFLPAVLGYSNLLKTQKRYFDAYNILISNKDKYPDNKELLLSTAEVCLMLEDYAKAKEILNYLSAKIKGDKDILKMQGKLYSVLGDTKRAELIFEQLLQVSPSEINMRAELADLYFHNDKYKEAANELIKYLNEKPQEVSARLKLGKAYEQMKKYDLAKHEYNKIIKNDAKNTEALAAIVELNKKEGNTLEAVRLANEIVDIQTDKTEDDDINSLSRSLELYEEAVKSYGDDEILSKNLDKLRPSEEEVDISLEQDLKDAGGLNFEDDDEITLSESFEDMPDLEMPFDDLMELADDENFDRGEDEDSLDNLVYMDTPIDDSPDIGSEYDPLDLDQSAYNKPRKNDIPEEEFQLQDTSKKEEEEVKQPAMPQSSPASAVPNESAPYQPEPPYQSEPQSRPQPQQKSSLPEPDYNEEFSSAAKPEAADSFISEDEEIEMTPESEAVSKPMAKSPLYEESPQTSNQPNLDEIDLTPDDDDLDNAESVDEIVNNVSEKPNISVLPHGVKQSPQFEEELDIIESEEIVKLFVYLRDLLDNLPAVELKDFLISNERIQMEYVINKLSGDVGLKRRMILLNVRGALKKTIDPKTSTDKTLKDVLGYLRIVSSQLPDKGFASACIGKINNLIKQIE